MNEKYEQVEKKLGVKLPDSYKAFATHYSDQKVKEGTWLNPQHLEALHNFESVFDDLSLLDTPQHELKKLIPVLVDDIAGDLVMLDYRQSASAPQVFTIQAQAMERKKKYSSFSEFLDTTCKNYSMKAKYLDVVEYEFA